MKLEDFRKLKPNEVAVVLDNGIDHVAITEYNQEGSSCGCCKNYSLDKAEVVVVRDAVSGRIIWPVHAKDFDYKKMETDREYWNIMGAPECATHFSKMTRQFFQKLDNGWCRVSVYTGGETSFQYCEDDVDVVHGGFIKRPDSSGKWEWNKVK